MKKKLAILMTFALTVTMLGGCGGNSQTVSSSGSADEDTIKSTDKKVETLSEYLRNEKTICYTVREMDKEETPTVYFFEDGKMTTVPLGLTLGDLSQMEDKEIWEAYKLARTTYAEEYAAKNEEERQSRISDMENLISHALENPEDDEGWSYENGYGSMYSLQEAYEELDRLKAYTYKGPFYDNSFSFGVVTDASGNYIQEEKIVYPTWEKVDNIGVVNRENIDEFYTSIDITTTAEGGDVQIYDTTYSCFPMTNGAIFCTRDSMTFDTVDSKDVLIDPASDELNELFRDEVRARYE